MDLPLLLSTASVLAPLGLMLLAVLLPQLGAVSIAAQWRAFLLLCAGAVGSTVIAIGFAIVARPDRLTVPALLLVTPLGLGMALLVQLLGTVIGGFSARYLEGETGQRRYVTALAVALAAVHLMLLSDHWLLLILAWALVGVALQKLLCFYPERAFARLAAHKKRIADRLADGLLIVAAALAWSEVGSGSLSDLWAHLARVGISPALQLSAVALVLAVILRTALLPVHGWLIQVMEAPTPVSALLHAGVLNLGGFVLIRFAPLLQQALPARSLLVLFGLATAVLAGMVMLTRISIKVRLAWSTVAQMGFMLLECGLGLYTLAALHLIGHSLYKAQAFLSASTVVRHTRLQAMHDTATPRALSLALAPAVAIAMVLLMQSLAGPAAWPWWWSAVLGLAWAPLLWLPAERSGLRAVTQQSVSGLLMVAGLSTAALLAHRLPLGTQDQPHHALGLIALLGMFGLYLGLVLLQLQPQAMRSWRRWSYAGFYVDEAYPRLALQFWPARWASAAVPSPAANSDA
ncbi:MAG: NADH-quinone oxidoreductase subunit L [Nevskia sp.]|nr:NADH-quinone oxidoreductase subunit L [Nevskia sp.]